MSKSLAVLLFYLNPVLISDYANERAVNHTLLKYSRGLSKIIFSSLKIFHFPSNFFIMFANLSKRPRIHPVYHPFESREAEITYYSLKNIAVTSVTVPCNTYTPNCFSYQNVTIEYNCYGEELIPALYDPSAYEAYCIRGSPQHG